MQVGEIKIDVIDRRARVRMAMWADGVAIIITLRQCRDRGLYLAQPRFNSQK
jgi:hypothetical protein